MPVNTHAKPRWYATPLLALGTFGFAAAWIMVALRYDRQFAWLAPLAAADMVLLLAAARHAPGMARAGWAFLATLATIMLANFGIIAAQVGLGMGLLPWESALKLGPDYAFELARLALRPIDLGWLALGLVVAIAAGCRRWAPSQRPTTR